MEHIQVDHPYVAAEETKHWFKLDNLNDASPSDIVVMKNMDVLLHLLQKTLRAQETIILKVHKRSNHDDVIPTIEKAELKWLKLTHTRSATPPQFVIMSNLWQLFQILQSMRESQEKVLQTLDRTQKRQLKGKTKSRPKKSRTSTPSHTRHGSGSNFTRNDDESNISFGIGSDIDTNHDSGSDIDTDRGWSSDNDSDMDRASGNDIEHDLHCDGDSSNAMIDPQAAQPTSALLNIMNDSLEHAYEVYSKFLATTGCHPYLTNTISCQKASKTFHRYFIDHEDLIGVSEIRPLVRQLDEDEARKLFIALSRKHKEANEKGKRRADEEPATHEQSMPNDASHESTGKRACIRQSSDDTPPFKSQDAHGSSLGVSHSNPRKRRGLRRVISSDSDDELTTHASLSCHGQPQMAIQPCQMQSYNSTGELQSTSRNLPRSPMTSVQRPINGIPRLASPSKFIQPCGPIDPPQVNKGRPPYSTTREPREPLKEKRNVPEIITSKNHY